MNTIINNKKNVCLVLLVALMLIFMNSFSLVYANDLNGVGSKNPNNPTNNETQVKPKEDTNTNQSKDNSLEPTSPDKEKKNKDVAKAVGDLFSNAGPDANAINEANEFLRPFAIIMNKFMAIILGVASLLMMLITVLDLLYMAFPPVRDLLDGGMAGGQQMQGGRGSRGMRRGYGGMQGGIGGMQGGFGGMNGMGAMGGMGGMDSSMPSSRQQQTPGGGLSALGRWVSDEAMAACAETQGGVMNGGQPGPIKSMLFSYMKKRSMFLILFGVCVILFTSTAFTDLGIRVGTWLLGIILGFGS